MEYDFYVVCEDNSYWDCKISGKNIVCYERDGDFVTNYKNDNDPHNWINKVERYSYNTLPAKFNFTYKGYPGYTHHAKLVDGMYRIKEARGSILYLIKEQSPKNIKGVIDCGLYILQDEEANKKRNQEKELLGKAHVELVNSILGDYFPPKKSEQQLQKEEAIKHAKNSLEHHELMAEQYRKRLDELEGDCHEAW